MKLQQFDQPQSTFKLVALWVLILIAAVAVYENFKVQ
jgi:hypothetical protein